jgi:hypothetical protein
MAHPYGIKPSTFIDECGNEIKDIKKYITRYVYSDVCPGNELFTLRSKYDDEFTLMGSIDEKGYALKYRIFLLEGIPVEMQRLYFFGKYIKNDELLKKHLVGNSRILYFRSDKVKHIEIPGGLYIKV